MHMKRELLIIFSLLSAISLVIGVIIDFNTAISFFSGGAIYEFFYQLQKTQKKRGLSRL